MLIPKQTLISLGVAALVGLTALIIVLIQEDNLKSMENPTIITIPNKDLLHEQSSVKFVPQPSDFSSCASEPINGVVNWNFFWCNNGIQFEYPSQSMVKNYKDHLLILNASEQEIINDKSYTDQPVGIYIDSYNVTTETLEQWLSLRFGIRDLSRANEEIKQKQLPLTSVKKISLQNGQSAYLVHEFGIAEGSYVYYFKNKNKIILAAVHYKSRLDDSVFKHVLTSLKEACNQEEEIRYELQRLSSDKNNDRYWDQRIVQIDKRTCEERVLVPSVDTILPEIGLRSGDVLMKKDEDLEFVYFYHVADGTEIPPYGLYKMDKNNYSLSHVQDY